MIYKEDGPLHKPLHFNHEYFFTLKLYRWIGDEDFADIVCEPDQLSEYLIFKSSVNVRDVSDQMCSVRRNAMPDLIDILRQQIDIKEIFSIVSKVNKEEVRFCISTLKVMEIYALIFQYKLY